MTEKPLHIFRAGTHTAQSGLTLKFSESDLAATAAAYDPAKHEAPLVVGHPATDDPAYGWVAALAASGDGLEATPRQVDPEFAAMVNAERFNRISSSFFMPDAPANPVPGVYYLRHVGFLGAAAPAVKGLRKPDFNFSDDAGTVTVEFSISPSQEVSFVSETKPKTPDQADPPAKPKAAEPAEQTVDYAAHARALEAQNAELKKAIERRDAEIAADRAKQRRAEIAAFAEKLVGEGRVLPRDRTGLIEFIAGISPDQAIEFAEDNSVVKTAARIWLDDFLKRLPVQIAYAERSRSDGDAPAKTVSRRDFDAMSPVKKMQLIRDGGRIVDQR